MEEEMKCAGCNTTEGGKCAGCNGDCGDEKQCGPDNVGENKCENCKEGESTCKC